MQTAGQEGEVKTMTNTNTNTGPALESGEKTSGFERFRTCKGHTSMSWFSYGGTQAKCKTLNKVVYVVCDAVNSKGERVGDCTDCKHYEAQEV